MQSLPLSPQAIEAMLAEAIAEAKRIGGWSPAPTDWQARVFSMFPNYFWNDFSQPHIELWEWSDGIEQDTTPRPFVAIWPRGRGKSTNAEAMVADLGARQKRTYCMYVCGTQDQADKHVQTIARMLESDEVTRYFPDVGKPRIGKNGSRNWNRQTVMTANGYTIEAIGLNKAVRGQKIDWARPDLIVFDDIDEKHDTELTTSKKEAIITGSILPAGAGNAAVLFTQNLIHSNSIASRLAQPPGTQGAANYLMDRTISGPFVAVDGLQYEAQQLSDRVRWVITGGASNWLGFDLGTCEDELNRVGPTAYLLESQHEVDTDNPNALLSEADFERTRVFECPELVRMAVAVDPPASTGTCGIVGGGKVMLGGEWHYYTMEDATTPPGVQPDKWALAVLQCYYRLSADVIFCETNNGGDMVENTIRQTKWEVDGKVLVDGKTVRIIQVHASRGKITRAQPVATIFLQGRAHHVGYFPELEKQWRQYQPGDESPDRLDASVWLHTGLEEQMTGVKIQVARGLYGSREKGNPGGRRHR
jgi:hypothetical protein